MVQYRQIEKQPESTGEKKMAKQETKWDIKLTAREDWNEIVVPLGKNYSEIMEIRDACLAEIATAEKGSIAWEWIDASIVPEEWPDKDFWDILAEST